MQHVTLQIKQELEHTQHATCDIANQARTTAHTHNMPHVTLQINQEP